MTAAIITYDQWLALRRGTIGSSDAAAACGESPYKSALRLWSEKRGLVPEEYIPNQRALRRGHHQERFALEEYVFETGYPLLPTATDEDRAEFERRIAARGACEVLGWVDSAGRPQAFLRSTRWPWMTATLDGAAELPDGSLEIVEAKSLGWRQLQAWGEADSGLAPTVYRFQVLHALAVTDAASAALVALIGNDALRIVRELAHAPTIPLDAIVEVERRFAECVAQDVEPTWDDAAAGDARRARYKLHPEDTGTSLVLASDALPLHEQLQAARTERLALGKRVALLGEIETKLESALEALLNGHTFGVLPDGSGEYVWKKWTRKGHVVQPSEGKSIKFKEAKL